MKILYTYQGLQQPVGGVSRYFFEIITRLGRRDTVEVCTRWLSNQYFRALLNRPAFTYKGWQHIRLRGLLENLHLCLRLLRGGYDVVHFTGEEAPVVPFVRRPLVITVHDMVPELFYNDARRHQLRRRVIRSADAIICVSENTRRDLLQVYPDTPAEKIHVIHHGFSVASQTYAPVMNCRFVLFVGSRFAQYKNFSRFLSALAPILEEEDLYLVCVGSKFSAAERAEVEQTGASARIIDFGFASDEQLANLYHEAVCFVYPSLYEGFGIPILEAFSHQCAACISNTSCFPEVGADAVDYFDPSDEASIRASVLHVVRDEAYRKALVEKGTARLQHFSWERAAEETRKVYESLLK